MEKPDNLPAYMQMLYNKIYGKTTLSRILDDPRIVQITHFFASNKIIKDLLKDIAKNAHVLQIGLTCGDEISAVYNKVHKRGKFDIFDVSAQQIERVKNKYAKFDMTITQYNAVKPWKEKYDVVICYNLLRELPTKTRQQIMDNALNCLTTGGKVIFVDYCEPEFWNPVKWPLFLFNRLYRPFAESLWLAPLESFCRQKENFRWYHTYYQGRIFQKVVAVRKILSNEDVLKLTKIFKEK